jgi:hypothetical protein
MLIQAIASGEFLTYDQHVPRLAPSDVQDALLTLQLRLEVFERTIAKIQEQNPDLERLFESVRNRRPSVPVGGDSIVWLFGAHDVIIDILRLSVALLRYASDPTSPFQTPELSPPSPIETVVEQLRKELATHDDVRGWSQDGYLWGYLTGEHTASLTDFESARAKYPALTRLFDSLVEEGKARFNRIAEAEGIEAALADLMNGGNRAANEGGRGIDG